MKNLFKNTLAAIVALFIAFVALPQAAQAQTKEAYVVKNGATLTFYYDTNKATRKGTVHGINDKRSDSANIPAWAGSYYTKNTRTINVVFDSSFKDFKLKTTHNWFNYCLNLSNIYGIENLCTDNVTDMGSMFYGCSSLTSLDVSKFNTANVSDIYQMFYDCSSLATIYCNADWRTMTVTDSDNMFTGCTNLVGAVAYDASKTDVTMANPTTGYFTKKDGSISQVEVSGEATIVEIYTIDGIRHSELQQGLNVIRMSDGTTRKIMHRQ